MNRKPFRLQSLWCAAALLFSAVPAAAQFDAAEVLGTVRDASGSVVAKPSIKLTNQDQKFLKALKISVEDES